MSQISKIFCLALPIQLRSKIDTVVAKANKRREEQLSRAQFIRDCIEYVLRRIEDGDMFLE